MTQRPSKGKGLTPGHEISGIFFSGIQVASTFTLVLSWNWRSRGGLEPLSNMGLGFDQKHCCIMCRSWGKLAIIQNSLSFITMKSVHDRTEAREVLCTLIPTSSLRVSWTLASAPCLRNITKAPLWKKMIETRHELIVHWRYQYEKMDHRDDQIYKNAPTYLLDKDILWKFSLVKGNQAAFN